MSQAAMSDLAPESFFSPDYYVARERFVTAAQAAGASLTEKRHPTATGPGGRPLWMDLAVLGPADATAVITMISGTHGPEGYCGSGVQTGLLLSGRARALADRGLKVVLLHAHNPYGFAWDTRFNEDNIDLNRNYLASFEAPLPANPNYDAIAPHAAPAERTPEALEAAEGALLAYAAQHGFPALQAALSGGQYNHPKGVYFGGVAPSWSHLTLKSLLSGVMAGAARFGCIDMHTGLGPEGHGEIITESDPSSDHYRRLEAILPGEICSTSDGSSVSAKLSGTMDTALLGLAGDRWSAIMALEFGTVDTMSVFRASQASSWLHVHGDREGPEAGEIRRQSRAAFYVETDSWKRAIWTRGTEVFDRTAAALLA